MFAFKWLQKNKQNNSLSECGDPELRIENGNSQPNNQVKLPYFESCDLGLLKEIINEIDPKYFSSNIDCGRFEIHNILGQDYRDGKVIGDRVKVLEKQSVAVCRHLSHLILERQPHYQREFNNVMLLREMNGDAYEQCIGARKSLDNLLKSIVEPHALVIRNHKRRLRLKLVLEVLKRIRTLQNNVTTLYKLIKENRFCEAISLHRQSCQVTEDFKPYGCVESLQHCLRSANLKIDDALDAVLARSCENFDPVQYSMIQKAFARLGSTMTTVAQLQLHYTKTIHTCAASAVANFVEGSSATESGNSVEFEHLCESLTAASLVPALSSLCKALWNVLVCYHRTALWHDNASRKSDVCEVPGDSTNPVDASDEVHAPELVRQWHGYVASKLNLNRGRVWMDVVSSVRPVLVAIASNARQLGFQEIVSTLNIVNRLVRVGEEFAGHVSFDLQEVLRNSIHGFFNEFHRKHMEHLRLFLDHERWEQVPVRPGFSLLDLHEFQPLTDLFTTNEDNCSADSGLSAASPTREKLFKEPYDYSLFDIAGEDKFGEPKVPVDAPSPPSQNLESSVVDLNSNSSSSREPKPAPSELVFANTTIEVLRLFGRYLQVMRLLQPIASEVMHCIGQLFDYYMFVVYNLFGKSFTSRGDADQLPDHLRKALTRISSRLIAPAGHPSVEKGNRFVVPDCILATSTKQLNGKAADISDLGEISDLLQRHLVGAESLVCLSSVLEKDLLPHLRECLPESKRGLLDVFRDQSLVTTLEVRDATAVRLASRILPRLLVICGQSKRDSNDSCQDLTGLLRQMIAANPRWTSKAVATEPSPYLRQVNAAVARLSSTLKALPPLGGSAARRALWKGVMCWLSMELLEGLAGVLDCSEEGRSQMLLDIQSVALLCETEAGIRSVVLLLLLLPLTFVFKLNEDVAASCGAGMPDSDHQSLAFKALSTKSNSQSRSIYQCAEQLDLFTHRTSE
uniref:DUF2451 domain-containing protein n=1 Tax=Mesocestoides corti TaxID=53468 RepID=A0A5K3F1F5_MESCO